MTVKKKVKVIIAGIAAAVLLVCLVLAILIAVATTERFVCEGPDGQKIIIVERGSIFDVSVNIYFKKGLFGSKEKIGHFVHDKPFATSYDVTWSEGLVTVRFADETIVTHLLD